MGAVAQVYVWDSNLKASIFSILMRALAKTNCLFAARRVISLQDVHVPEANLLPESGGLKSPLMCLNQARYGISWGVIGATEDYPIMRHMMNLESVNTYEGAHDIHTLIVGQS